MKMIMVGAAALTAAAILVAVSPAGAEDIGSTPLKTMGSNPGAYCKGPQSAICSTIQPTKKGTGNYVLTVFAPSSTPVNSFDVWSGTRATKLRPKSICKDHGTSSKPQYQVGTYHVTRCKETIKPNKHRSYCLSGLTRLPSTNAGVTYPVYVDGHNAGAGNVTSIPATSKCPPSVGKRKRLK